MTYVNSLADVGASDIAMAGGKAVGLGGLLQAGLPVPPGFVLNTAAYSHFVETNHLEARIQELATLSPQAAPQDSADASEQIQTLFTGGHHAGRRRSGTRRRLRASRRRGRRR
ncbi:PEP/pyruvate-binding domain-containing protein [Pseudarthrobacter sp. Y6]|uniref:PEP/pyruvate-binding domain-containing protein n=1 Tax=Pseudarthrobacter sp. Y6 TaxID=3418422 RepID=UPI003CF6B234